MKSFLKKLKLIRHLQTELDIQKHEFIRRLKQIVDEGENGSLSETFDSFSSSKNEYKGYVDNRGFKIKRRRKLLDVNMNLAMAEGTYHQSGDKLIIKTEINGFHGMMIPFYIIAILFYCIFIGIFLVVEDMEANMPLFFFPFILVHAIFMLGAPYLIMRRSTVRLKHELEREFYFLTKK